jgi:hypothetical protein
MLQVSVVGYCIGSFFISLGFFDGWWFLVVLATALQLHVRKALGATATSSVMSQRRRDFAAPQGAYGTR